MLVLVVMCELSVESVTDADRSGVFETQWHKGEKYRYARFTTTKTRDPFSKMVQIGRFAFYAKTPDMNLQAERAGNTKILHDASYVPVEVRSVANPGGNNPPLEGPDNLLDGDQGTKWLDKNKGPLVFDFGEPRVIDGFNWATAHDVRAHGRDPVRWKLEGANDPEDDSWVVLQEQQGDFTVHKNRMSWVAVSHNKRSELL